jgi:hypothetical protein
MEVSIWKAEAKMNKDCFGTAGRLGRVGFEGRAFRSGVCLTNARSRLESAVRPRRLKPALHFIKNILAHLKVRPFKNKRGTAARLKLRLSENKKGTAAHHALFAKS